MAEKRTIEQHISEDHKILEDPNISPQRRRHIEDELSHLERYAKEHEKLNAHEEPCFVNHSVCVVSSVSTFK